MQKTCTIKIIAVSLSCKIKARTIINIKNSKKNERFIQQISRKKR